MVDKALAARLRSAREKVGLSLIEASNRLGFANYQTLSKIEGGERTLKAAELFTFAKAYYTSINELLGVQESRPGASFLWRSEGKRDERAQAEGRIARHCANYALLERSLGLPRTEGFPMLVKSRESIRTGAEVDEVAARACNLLNLGKRPACALSKVVEQEYRVKLLYLPLSDAGSAASIIHPDWGPVIAVNSDEAPWRRAYDLGHEVFHLLADPDHQVLNAYGVWGPKKYMGREYMGVLRTTFLIGKDGEILKVFENVKPDGHSAEILAELPEAN